MGKNFQNPNLILYFSSLKKWLKILNVQDKAMIIAMEYAAGGTLLELLDARVRFA
jgi:hypothetical protein